jgi:hypothetical protein
MAQQRQRLTLTAHLMCAASLLQAEWESDDMAIDRGPRIRPGLLARIRRICRTQAIDTIAMGHVLIAEAHTARHGDLLYLEWLTREVELSLAGYAAGVLRYLQHL